MTPDLATAVDWLKRAERVTVLTGAGISAESGVPTFRDADGLWEGHEVEDVASPDAFRRSPETVWRFYNQRRTNLRTVQPNPGHFALVTLEQRLPAGAFTLVTQNVDHLHRLAGSRNVLEVHGDLYRVRCTSCTYNADRGLEELPPLPECPECGKLLRPDIVWFGEMLPTAIWEAAARAVVCDVFLTVGTSAVVYPAAGLIDGARQCGAKVIEVNPNPSGAAVDLALAGPAGQVLPALVAG